MIKSKFKYIGIIISILSLIYIYHVIKNSKFETIPFHKYSLILLISTFFLFSVINIISIFICSIIWKIILEFISRKKLNNKEIINVYLKSNISKYLPGNVMQYASRNFLGEKFGWDREKIIYSSALELFLGTLFTFILFIICIILTGKADLNRLSFLINKNYIYLFIFIAIIFNAGILFWGLKSKKLYLLFTKTNFREIKRLLLKCFSLYFVNSAINILIAIWVFYLYSETFLSLNNMILIAASTVIAYFVGFVAVGSPAGIGVRESIMIILLSPICNPVSILIALAVLRLTSIIGDVLAYFITIFFFRNKYLKIH
ncbi:MAG: hypothetical protein WC223_00730 [Bacteroidales bacterium]